MNQYGCEGNKTVLRNHYSAAKHWKTHWFPYYKSVNLSFGQGTKMETVTDSHSSFCWSINRGAAVPSEGLTNGQLSVSGRWTWKTAVWGFSSPWCESCTKQPVRKLMQTWKRKKSAYIHALGSKCYQLYNCFLWDKEWSSSRERMSQILHWATLKFQDVSWLIGDIYRLKSIIDFVQNIIPFVLYICDLYWQNESQWANSQKWVVIHIIY